MVLEHLNDYPSECAAVEAIAPKIGCAAQTLHGWIHRQQTDTGQRPGPTSDERERIKALERENRELRKANEILRLASAYFAQAELNGLYKAELIYRQSWKSREAVEMATLKWRHWYNHQRLLSSIGYIPPAEAEANFHQGQAGQAMAA